MRTTITIVSLPCVVLFGLVWAPLSVLAAKDKKSRPAEATIAGSVFREDGFTLRGAEVEIVVSAEQEGGKKRPTSWKGMSDSRGEFAVRVPAGPVRYTVIVRASGFQPQQKEVTIGADERVEHYFRLEAGAKSPGVR